MGSFITRTSVCCFCIRRRFQYISTKHGWKSLRASKNIFFRRVRPSPPQMSTRQCKYNVTLRRFRESLLPWKSNKYYVFVCVRARAFVRVPGSVGVCMCVNACSLPYPACNSYPPYCDVICGFSGATIFFDIINGTIFEKKKKSYFTQNLCFYFLYNLCLERFSF